MLLCLFELWNHCCRPLLFQMDSTSTQSVRQQVLSEQIDIRRYCQNVHGLLRKQESEMAWLESRLKLHRQESELEARHSASRNPTSARGALAGVQQEIESMTKQLEDETRLCADYKRQSTELRQEVLEIRKRDGPKRGAGQTAQLESKRVEMLRARLQRSQAAVSEANIASAALKTQIASAHCEKHIFNEKIRSLQVELHTEPAHMTE